MGNLNLTEYMATNVAKLFVRMGQTFILQRGNITFTGMINIVRNELIIEATADSDTIATLTWLDTNTVVAQKDDIVIFGTRYFKMMNMPKIEYGVCQVDLIETDKKRVGVY